MQYEKYFDRVKYLQELIQKEATGTPKDLARRLGISERMLYRYLCFIDGNPNIIEYCRKKKSYKFGKLS